MSDRDPLEVAALRAQRRLLAERYQVENASFDAGHVGALMVGAGLVALGASGLLIALGVELALMLPVGGFVSASLLLVGGFLRWTNTDARETFARERARVTKLERELPRFFGELSTLAGGSVVIDEGLEGTLAFLERTGMFGVPSLLLARLFNKGNRRHRLEGSVGGTPFAIVVVLGEPGGGTARPHTAMSRSALGPHLFVVVPGVERTPGEREGYDLVHDGSDLVAIRGLGELPEPRELVAWIQRLGACSVAPVEEGPPPPRYRSAMEAVRHLVQAAVSNHPAAAIAAMDPQLFWKRRTVSTVRAVRLWAEEWALVGAELVDVRPGPVGTFATECWVRIDEGANQRQLTVQAFEQPPGSFRVCYLGDAERGGGWHDTSQDSMTTF